MDLASFEPRTTTFEVLLDWNRLGRLKLIKQADVVLLLAVLSERWSRAVHKAKLGYCEPLTAHDSSLSPPVHSLLAARLGDLDTADSGVRWRGTLYQVTATGGSAAVTTTP